LQVGDRIVAIDGEPLSDWRSLAERIRALPGREVVLRWERGGTELVQRVTIAVATDRDGQTIGRLGVQPAPAAGEQRLVRYSGWAALAYGWQKTAEVSLLTLRLLGKMVVGEASVKNLSGPLTLASAAATSAELGLVPYLAFLALVSVSLGVLNLLPIPVLDGGHLLYHLWEWVRGRPLPEAVQQLGQKIGLVLIGMLMAIALVNDFLRGLG
jgi:regulator of sigma E protease